MGRERRGVQGIRTMGALVDSRRTRTAAGALLELSAMANEKLLLQKELERWTVRHGEIRRRLSEIAAKEQRLMALVQDAPGGAIAGVRTSPSALTVTLEEATQEVTIEAPLAKRVRIKEFTY